MVSATRKLETVRKDLETPDLLLGCKVHIPKLPKEDKCQDKKQVELMANIPEKRSLYKLYGSTKIKSLLLLTSAKAIRQMKEKFTELSERLCRKILIFKEA